MNKKFPKCGYLAIALLALLLFAVQAVAAGSDEVVLNLLKERVDNGYSVGMAVGVLNSDEVKFICYGKTSSGGAAVGENTIFEIGSISKVFTSLLLADAVERGEVKYDDTVAGSLAAVVKISGEVGLITLKNLSTQTSGLPRMPANFNPKNPADPYSDYFAKDLYAFLETVKLNSPPGKKYDYSNLGVGLLGNILETKLKGGYEKLVVERICKVLNMSDTSVEVPKDKISRFSKGHAGTIETSYWNLNALAGAGALRSTAKDIIQFLRAQMDPPKGNLGKAIVMTHEIFAPAGTPDLGITLGWHAFDKFGGRYYWHNGGTGGFRSFMGFDPAAKRAVVVLSNSSMDVADDIGLNILNAQFKLKPIKMPVVIDYKIYDEYIGEYEFAPGAIMTVTRDGDNLFAQLTGQEKCRIFPLSPKRFFYTVVEAEIEFERNDKNITGSLILFQAGRKMEAKKYIK
jgi:CubicO group peptidase (beta-lactamase class C family)